MVATVTTGVTVKDDKGSHTFAPGSSLFALLIEERARVTISAGVALTLATASSEGETTTTVQYDSSAARGAVNLCVLNSHQPTVTGLGLVCRGPTTFSLNITGDPVSILGNIEVVGPEGSNHQAKEVVTKKAELKELSKKRKLETKEQVENDKDDDTKEASEGNDDDAAPPQPLSKRQRKKLAQQKVKELKETVAKLNGHIDNDGTIEIKEKKNRSITKERLVKGGVSVRDMLLGQGPAVKTGRKVGILYEGTLLDTGKVFDKKKNKSSPLLFRQGTGQVVRGLENGLEGMRVGGEREITIPPKMGYGTKGSGHVIPPDSTLVFKVQLLSVGN